MNENCTVNRTSKYIGKRWMFPLLIELHKGRAKWKRYSHLKRKVPDITPKVLSQRLRELEDVKMLKRKVNTSAFPIKSEYCLTPSGEDFIPIIKQMKRWALKWNIKNEHCEKTDCRDCEY
jgi:DNA-binding HxlR family transcriptional regulator